MKPVVWSNPIAAAGAAIVLGWLASVELGSSRTASREAAAGGTGEIVVDTATGRLFDAAALISLVTGFGASLLMPATAIRSRRTSFGTGMALLIASGVLSSAARRRLGRFHRDSLTVHGDHRVVVSGPYQYVRHPLYLATIGVFTGTGAILGNWVSVVAAALPTAALTRRIAVEERMLVDYLGDDYVAYQERTNRLIPALW